MIEQSIVTMISVILIFSTICWHLGWQELFRLSHLAEQSENFLSLASRCLPVPSWLEGTKQLPTGKPESANDLFLLCSLLLALKMELCVSAQSSEGSSKEKLMPTERVKTKVQSFPAKRVICSLLPRSQAWIMVAVFYCYQQDFHREARFQGILLRAGVCR